MYRIYHTSTAPKERFQIQIPAVITSKGKYNRLSLQSAFITETKFTLHDLSKNVLKFIQYIHARIIFSMRESLS